MNRFLKKMLKWHTLILCIAFLSSCSSENHTDILTAEIVGGGMVANIPAEGGYFDIDVVSNFKIIVMEWSISLNGKTPWFDFDLEDISSETISATGDMKTIRLTFAKNTSSNNRTIYIRFAGYNSKIRSHITTDVITVTQD